MGGVTLKKRVFGAVIVSLAAGAVLGVAAVLNDLGEVGTKALLTTWIICGVSLLALAPAVQLERGKHGALSFIGAFSAVVSGGMATWAIWSETSPSDFWEWTAIIGLVAVGCSHASLVLLSSLSKRYTAVQFAAIALGFAFVGQLIFAILADQEPIWKLLSVNAILVTACSLSVLAFNRLSAIERLQNGSGSSASALRCPCCSGAVARTSTGESCTCCGCEFVIKTPGRGGSKG